MSLIETAFRLNVPFGQAAYVWDEVLLHVRFVEMLVGVGYAVVDWTHCWPRCYFQYLLAQ